MPDRQEQARAALAKRWRQSPSQISDAEVAWYLGEPAPPVICLTAARKPKPRRKP